MLFTGTGTRPGSLGAWGQGLPTALDLTQDWTLNYRAKCDNLGATDPYAEMWLSFGG